jgi:hypothetical protein
MYEHDGSESEATEIDFDVEEPNEPEDNMTDVEADADTLRCCGMGTDEDYGYFGDNDF